MNNQSKRLVGLFARYLFVLLLGAGNLYFFYTILTPLTVSSVSQTISLFTEVVTEGSFIHLESFSIELVRGCVAGSAFFLMFILVFSTADIKPKKRFYALITSLAMLFVLNFLRILFLVLIYSPTNIYFDAIHWVLWHLVSVCFVVGIWFSVVKLYKFESVPIYSDIKFLLNFSNKGKKSKRGKKN
ncbi:MAG: pacearchaeosortase [Candidatus Pacearchaeota archaeon]